MKLLGGLLVILIVVAALGIVFHHLGFVMNVQVERCGH